MQKAENSFGYFLHMDPTFLQLLGAWILANDELNLGERFQFWGGVRIYVRWGVGKLEFLRRSSTKCLVWL